MFLGSRVELDYLAEVSPEPEVVNVMVRAFPDLRSPGVLMGPRQRLGTSTAWTRRMGPHCHPGNHGEQWQVCVGVLGERCPEPCVHLVQRRRAAHPVEAG